MKNFKKVVMHNAMGEYNTKLIEADVYLQLCR